MKTINNIPEDIYYYVNTVLYDLEKEFNIKILYAVESGSRCWGFSNKESDYDIRFIYTRPIEEYINISSPRDVIDRKDLGERSYDYPLDLSGWDISKALFLHYKNNPNLNEYIRSNMVYRGDTSIFEGLVEFNPVSLKHHYSSMTRKPWKKYVKGDEMTPRVTKRYCYSIRQILCWILIDDTGKANNIINIDDLFEHFKNDERFPQQLMIDLHSIIDYYRSNCTLRLSEEAIENVSNWITRYIMIMKEDKSEYHQKTYYKIYNYMLRLILKQSAVPDLFDEGPWLRCYECKHHKGMRLDEYETDTWCELEYPHGTDAQVFCGGYEKDND